MSEPTGNYQEDPDSEFYLEITPLSPAEVVTHSRVGRRPWQLLPAGAAVLLVLALVLTHLPFTHTPLAIRSPTPTVISFTSIIVAPASAPGVLGVVPSNCPPGNPIHTFSPSYAPGVSVDTLGIWVVGFSDINATLHLERSPKTPLGWEKKLVIVAASTLTADITLWIESIASLPGADTTTPHLSRGGAGLATTALTLNLKTAPVSFEGEWTSWPLNVFIPSSGCYSLDFRYGGAEISGTYFAAGQ